ncbi:MAG: hypothetical protein FWH57_09855 [Oscillospiraceae bacterium]|nr:hypothetical protein [Oscillospiraceae bacterium]
MSFFNVFKPKSKRVSAKKHTHLAVEDQLMVLSDLGIRPKRNDFVEWICNEWGRDAVESDPYNLMLFSLGGERCEDDGTWEYVSDDIYTFDSECVEESDIYANVLKRLSVLSKGLFTIHQTSSVVDHDNGRASVSFTHNEKKHIWDLKYDNDWFDCDVINKINDLLKNDNSSMFFYTSSPDQNSIVLFASGEIIEKINNLVTVPFVFGVRC